MTKDTVVQTQEPDEVAIRELSPVECCIEELREVLPEAFREGQLDSDRLLALLRGPWSSTRPDVGACRILIASG
jgi:hypothetical protein